MGGDMTKSLNEVPKDQEEVKGQGTTETEKKPCKPCCACPETKRVRDACIVENGEESCVQLIEAHRECMRKLGFNI